jgi:phosphatidylglycerol lysyltransferase
MLQSTMDGALAFQDDGRRRVLDLVCRYGWNATAFQTLGKGYQYFFCGEGCVAYVDTGSAWVAAGAPISASARLREVAVGFVEAARQAGRRCCFFGSEGRFVLAAGEALSALPIGEQPVWDPRDWPRTLEWHAGLRYALRRPHHKGVHVQHLLQCELAANEGLRVATADLTTSWLSTRRMPPMEFLLRVEPDTIPDHRQCFLAEWYDRLVGLVYVVPVPERKGWFIEQMMRDPHAPNGTIELLVDAVMRWASNQGSSWLTLGAAPLSGDVPLLLRVARKQMAFLYDFEGLRSFKAKLRPKQWHPIYVSYPTAQGAFPSIVDVLAAFARKGPPSSQPMVPRPVLASGSDSLSYLPPVCQSVQRACPLHGDLRLPGRLRRNPL